MNKNKITVSFCITISDCKYLKKSLENWIKYSLGCDYDGHDRSLLGYPLKADKHSLIIQIEDV